MAGGGSASEWQTGATAARATLLRSFGCITLPVEGSFRTCAPCASRETSGSNESWQRAKRYPGKYWVYCLRFGPDRPQYRRMVRPWARPRPLPESRRKFRLPRALHVV